MFVLKKHIFCLKGSNIYKNAFSLYYPSTRYHFPLLQGHSELCPGSQAPREHLQCLPVQMIYGCYVRSIQTQVWINEWFAILLSDYRCLVNMKRGKIDWRGNVLLCLRIQLFLWFFQGFLTGTGKNSEVIIELLNCADKLKKKNIHWKIPFCNFLRGCRNVCWIFQTKSEKRCCDCTAVAPLHYIQENDNMFYYR